MNRDERRARSEGLPPGAWWDADILAPRDPDAGGTWIGVRPDGVWACVLNAYIDDNDLPIIDVPETRGRLIPHVLNCDDPFDALKRLDLTRTHGFRMWLGTDAGVTDVLWNGHTLAETQPLQRDRFAFVTSSSVDQEKVKALRAAVFSSWVDVGAPHHSNGLPSLLTQRAELASSDAIAMAREHSHTKSCTQITIGDEGIGMQHWDFDHRLGSAVSTVKF